MRHRLVLGLLLLISTIGCDRKPEQDHSPTPPMTPAAQLEAGSITPPIPLSLPTPPPESGSLLSSSNAPAFTPPRFGPEAGSTTSSVILPIPTAIPESGSMLGNSRTPVFSPPGFVPEAGSSTGRNIIRNSPVPRVRSSPPPSLSRALSDERRREAELSSILANRHRFRSIPEPAPKPSDSQLIPEELRDFVGRVMQVTVAKTCGWRFPTVVLRGGTRIEVLTEVINAGAQIGYGIAFEGTEGLEASLNAIHDPVNPATTTIRHLSISDGEITPACGKLLGQLTQVKSLALHRCGVDEEVLADILQNEHLEAIELVNTAAGLDLRAIAQVAQRKNITRFHWGDTHSHVPHLANQNPSSSLLMALAEMPQLEYLHIDHGTASSEAVQHFLEKGDHSNLRYLSLKSEPLTLWYSEGFARCPQLEEVTVDIHTGRNDYATHFLSSLKHADGKSVQAITIRLPDNELFTGLTAAKVLTSLSEFPNLKRFKIPLKVEKASHLEPLTRLGHLSSVSLKNLHLDREALLMLCRMPSLEGISVQSLKFGNESAHLTPWLNIEWLYIEETSSITTEQIHLLARCPRLNSIAYWNTGQNYDYEVQRLYPHITFHEYD